MTEYDNKLNDQIDKMYGAMGISKEAVSFGRRIEGRLKERFEKIDLMAQ